MSRSRTRRDKRRRAANEEAKSNGKVEVVAATPSGPENEAPELAALVAELEDNDIRVEFREGAEEEATRPVLEKLVASQREGTKLNGPELIALVREAKEAGVLIPEAEKPVPKLGEGGSFDELASQHDEADEPGEAVEEDFPPVLLPDPLVLGIQIGEALLNEAKAGYIANRVVGLEEALGEQFSAEGKQRIAQLASTLRDENGLPDVNRAYRQLILDQG